MFVITETILVEDEKFKQFFVFFFIKKITLTIKLIFLVKFQMYHCHKNIQKLSFIAFLNELDTKTWIF